MEWVIYFNGAYNVVIPYTIVILQLSFLLI